MWNKFIELNEQYRLGDVASIIGVVVSLIGFIVTIVGVWRSKRAAELAAMAAQTARESVQKFEVVADFSATIALERVL